MTVTVLQPLHEQGFRNVYAKYKDTFFIYIHRLKHKTTHAHSFIYLYTSVLKTAYPMSTFFKIKMKNLNCTCWRKSGNGPKEFSCIEQGMGAHLLLARRRIFSLGCIWFGTSIYQKKKLKLMATLFRNTALRYIFLSSWGWVRNAQHMDK